MVPQITEVYAVHSEVVRLGLARSDRHHGVADVSAKAERRLHGLRLVDLDAVEKGLLLAREEGVVYQELVGRGRRVVAEAPADA